MSPRSTGDRLIFLGFIYRRFPAFARVMRTSALFSTSVVAGARTRARRRLRHTGAAPFRSPSTPSAAPAPSGQSPVLVPRPSRSIIGRRGLSPRRFHPGRPGAASALWAEKSAGRAEPPPPPRLQPPAADAFSHESLMGAPARVSARLPHASVHPAGKGGQRA